MARKQVEEVKTDDLIADLLNGTQFELIKEGEGKGSISDKPTVKTPCYALNSFLGGGIPLGSLVEVYGSNASGKSSFMYETLGNFQKQYSNGVAFIIDTETSTDNERLKQLGVDPSRAPRMGANTLEDGFEQISKVLRKMINDSRYNGFPVMIVWDTIAAAATRAQVAKEDMYGGGMAERARIIKSSLMTLFPLIEKLNVLIVLLNQVMAEIGGWRPGLTSGGGNGLKHDIHLKISIEGGKTNYDGVYAMSKYSKLSVEKSKISPIINDIPLIIDITKGGVIDRSGSMVWWMTMLTSPAIFNQASWWSVTDDIKQRYLPYWNKFPEFVDKFRQSTLYEVASRNEDFVNFMQLIWLDLISDRYTLQKEVCKKMRSEIETQLMMNLGLTYEELNPAAESSSTEVDLGALSDALSGIVNTETGEVIADGEISE